MRFGCGMGGIWSDAPCFTRLTLPEPAAGIEPATYALPLRCPACHRLSLGGESNSRHQPYHGCVLPLNYLGSGYSGQVYRLSPDAPTLRRGSGPRLLRASGLPWQGSMPSAGFEPAIPCGSTVLSRTRIPFPPRGRPTNIAEVEEKIKNKKGHGLFCWYEISEGPMGYLAQIGSSMPAMLFTRSGSEKARIATTIPIAP